MDSTRTRTKALAVFLTALTVFGFVAVATVPAAAQTNDTDNDDYFTDPGDDGSDYFEEPGDDGSSLFPDMGDIDDDGAFPSLDEIGGDGDFRGPGDGNNVDFRTPEDDDGDSDDGDGDGDAGQPTGIDLTLGSTSLTTGDTTSATVTLNYDNGTTEDVTSAATLSSSNTSVASTSGSTVTAEGEGSATISADAEGFSDSVSVSVQSADDGDGDAGQPTGIDLSLGSTSLFVGNTTSATVTLSYDNGTTEDVTSSATLSSSNTSVATVSGSTVTAAGAGSATITADAEGFSDSVSVSVQSVDDGGGDGGWDGPREFTGYLRSNEAYFHTGLRQGLSDSEYPKPVIPGECEDFQVTQDAIESQPDTLPDPGCTYINGTAYPSNNTWVGEIDYATIYEQRTDPALGEVYAISNPTTNGTARGSFNPETGEVSFESTVDLNLKAWDVESHDVPWDEKGFNIFGPDCKVPDVAMGGSTENSFSPRSPEAASDPVAGERLQNGNLTVVKNDFAIGTAINCDSGVTIVDNNDVVNAQLGIPSNETENEVVWDFHIEYLDEN
jgi:uncharacterized protein YjdB